MCWAFWSGNRFSKLCGRRMEIISGYAEGGGCYGLEFGI
jgi:hypothetical protein